MNYCGTDVLTFISNRVQEESIINEVVSEERVNINDEQSKHGCQNQLNFIVGNSLDYVLQGTEFFLGEVK